jgi:ferredoxin
MSAVVLTPADRAVDALITALSGRGYVVIAPTVRDGAIVLGEVRSVTDLPIGWSDEQDAATYRVRDGGGRSLFHYAVGPTSPRRYLSPPRQTLWSVHRTADGFEIDDAEPPPRPFAFVGVRACELAAVAVQDHVLRDGRHPDPAYTLARDRAFFVGVTCARPASTCFCASAGTGPAIESGQDVALTELLDDGRHEVLVGAATERGAEVVEELKDSVTWRRAEAFDTEREQAIVASSVAAMRRHLDLSNARDVLRGSLEHNRWDDVASRCLSCTNCTLVCPTCFCSAVEDVTSLSGDRAERLQRWDSCFTLGHSVLHGMGSVRADTRSRYRQWLTHKLSTWWDQFGESGCVGCGRCISWCPAGIDLTEEVAAMDTRDSG